MNLRKAMNNRVNDHEYIFKTKINTLLLYCLFCSDLIDKIPKPGKQAATYNSKKTLPGRTGH